MQWYEYFSDRYINSLLTLVVADYKVVAMFVVGPIIWAINKYTTWTPWTTDDKIADMIKKRLGMGDEK